MAELRVERKGRNIWPWIVGLIVLALLIWALMELLRRNDPEAVEGEPVASAPPTVRHRLPGNTFPFTLPYTAEAVGEQYVYALDESLRSAGGARAGSFRSPHTTRGGAVLRAEQGPV